MGILRSKLGWALVVIYLIGFITVLDILALPYILIVGRLLLQEPTFAVHAHEPWGLVPAVVFCSALILLMGAGLGRLARRITKRRQSGGTTSPL
jgi:hypothetical protein